MSNRCAECGMTVNKDKPYHPYAACLMFKGCANSEMVQSNLDSVLSMGEQYGKEKGDRIVSAALDMTTEYTSVCGIITGLKTNGLEKLIELAADYDNQP